MQSSVSSAHNSFPLAGGSRRRRLLTRHSAAAVVQPAAHSLAVFGCESVRELLENGTPLTWVFTGDSIPHGVKHTYGRRNFTEHFAERVRWELRRFQDVVINTAVVGERVAGLLNDLDRRALRFQPEVVSIMIGLRDATDGEAGLEEFRLNLRRVANRVLEADAHLILQTPNRIDGTRVPRLASLPQYVDVVREISCEFDVPLIDHWAYWEEAATAGRRVGNWLARDGIHPNVQGHRMMAQLIFGGLGIYDADSATCAPLPP